MESSITMRIAETNSTALTEALCAQQQLLQKLYNELDVERESSATAASEALSMILRLQGEKAAVKMEAEQYKRLAEEKMQHAEESMAIFEDIMYQKEMEIASLDYQVQAYRYKLLSMGCNDPGVGEIKFPENLLQRNETLVGETSSQSAISRRNSAPPLKLSYLKKGTFDREKSSSPETDMISMIMEESGHEEGNGLNSDSEKKTESLLSGDINSYWEQIRKLDERVKEMAGEQYANIRGIKSRSSSVLSLVSMGCDTKKCGTAPDDSSDNEVIADSACSLRVHDVFEVPQTVESLVKDEKKVVLQGDERVIKLDCFPRKDGIDLGKKILLSAQQESNFCKPVDCVDVDCHLAIVRPTIPAGAKAKLQQLNRTTEIIEVERQNVRQEPATRGEEELKLLNEIREQLNSIQYEIRSWKTKKSSAQYELQMFSLMEGMLHFWL